MPTTWQAGRRPALISPVARGIAWGCLIGYVILALLVSFTSVSQASWPFFAFLVLVTVFVVLHGLMVYRVADVVVYYAVVLVVINILENLSIQTGFPFGHYYYTDLRGPKLFEVPISIGLYYAAAGYAAWIVAVSLLRMWRQPPTGWKVVGLPVIASFVMVLWDLGLDPYNSTLQQGWVWTEGGAYFGVPISNFPGWYLTVFTFYFLFTLYLWATRDKTPTAQPPGRDNSLWYLAIVLYAAQGLVRVLVAAGFSDFPITDNGGTVWSATDLVQSTALVTVMTLGFVALLAGMTVADRSRRPESPATDPPDS